jgi:hypothetical protein
MRHRRLHRHWLATLVLVIVALGVTVGLAHAQRGRRNSGFVEPNVPYDGRFTFVRLMYTNLGGRGGWAFDYPAMERNFMTILHELTTVGPHVKGSNVLTMDDTALYHYTVAYLSEPGYWAPDEAEATGLRNWLQKGGFLIVDDFFGRQWEQFEESMRQVLPEARIMDLDVSHPIFISFFTFESLDGLSHPSDTRYKAIYRGIYEDNDPRKRLMVIINYNNDIGDFMEWSGEGWYPINFTNDAYKLATNYVVYGLTR